MGNKKEVGQLFEKAACFTDLHYGLKHNSNTHNQDCEDYVNWFISEAKKRGCETCIFLGDYHHNRNTLNISTMGYSLRGLKLLSENFDKVYFIAGNHDIYYREKRDVHSLELARELENVIIIDKPFVEGDVAIVPWLVNDEWKILNTLDAKYLFGHFEIPGFKMSATIEMPDAGGLNSHHFGHFDYVFSGHFHYRQSNTNVHYIGNAFPHNYGDSGDTSRGAMFLEWGGAPEYVDWDEAPFYVQVPLSQLLENLDHYLRKKGYVKVTLDVDITYEEANFLRETFMKDYEVRELKFVSERKSEHKEDNGAELSFESVDEIVLDQLSNIQSDSFDRVKLVDIYNNL